MSVEFTFNKHELAGKKKPLTMSEAIKGIHSRQKTQTNGTNSTHNHHDHIPFLPK